MSDFNKNRKQLDKEVVQLNNEEKLNYIRNKMYPLMSKSETLKKFLVQEYKKKKNMLNFEITK